MCYRESIFPYYKSFTTHIKVFFQVEPIRKTSLSCSSKAKLNLPRSDYGFSVFVSSAMVALEPWRLP